MGKVFLVARFEQVGRNNARVGHASKTLLRYQSTVLRNPFSHDILASHPSATSLFSLMKYLRVVGGTISKRR